MDRFLTTRVFSAHAQIGHGGDREAITNKDLSGEIIVEAGNDLITRGGNTRETYAMVGHGGYDNPRDVTTTTSKLGGNITVTVGNNVDFRGGSGYYGFAQLGHGGKDQRLASFTKSDITVIAGGDVIFIAGPSGPGTNNDNYAQLGNGGSNSSVNTGGYSGDITVNAGWKKLISKEAHRLAVMLNLGMADTPPPVITLALLMSLLEVTLFFTGGSGTNAYAQIGHGGLNTTGDLSGFN